MAIVCATCREVDKHCKHDGRIIVGYKWTAPRKTNDLAWKRISKGDIWWDKRRIDRPMRARMQGGGWFFNRGSVAKPEWMYFKKIPEGMKFLSEHARTKRKNV